jgi:ABC-type nitrate/sulfonate/bicarbonate transport system substrate-binding protein
MIKIFLVLIALLIPFGATVPLRAQQLHMHSGAGVSATQLPFWTAKHLGIFAKYGLTVELVAISSGARGMQALVGGSTQSANMAAMSPIRTVLAGGEVVIVAGYLNKSLFKLVAQRDIRQASDLRGKRIGLANFGGSTEFGVLMALKELNVPREAVKLLPAGGSGARFAALEAKGLDATLLPYGESLIAEKRGFTILADLPELVKEFPDRLIIVRRASVEKDRGGVKRFLQATSEALFEIRNKSSRERIVAILAKELKVDRKLAEENYEKYQGAFSLPPRVGRKGLAAVLELMQHETGKSKAELDVNRFVDESVLDELEMEGFFKRLQSSSKK